MRSNAKLIACRTRSSVICGDFVMYWSVIWPTPGICTALMPAVVERTSKSDGFISSASCSSPLWSCAAAVSGLTLSRKKILPIVGAPAKYSGFASNSMNWSGVYEVNVYGPEPIGLLPVTKSLALSTSPVCPSSRCFGMIECAGSVMFSRNTEFGAASVNLTVCGSIASTDSVTSHDVIG